MKIIIRTDASIKIGTGHVMRCLTLAHLLRGKGAEVTFICSNAKGNLIEFIEKQDYEVYKISGCRDYKEDGKYTSNILNSLSADLLIIDHYHIGLEWESIVKDQNKNIKIMVIDDLANREHVCDILLDQNYFKEYQNRYNYLVPMHCKKLLGPKYLLLRQEFYDGNEPIEKKQSTKNILVFYGGSDPTNETLKVLQALNKVDCSKLTPHIVVGLANVHNEKIRKICEERNYSYYLQIDYLSRLMQEADFALGAGGVTMWERCFLGLPSIVTIVADNQKESTQAAADFGAIWNLGWHEGVRVSDLVDIFNRALESEDELKNMSKRAKQLMHSDVMNDTHPVVEAIMEVINS